MTRWQGGKVSPAMAIAYRVLRNRKSLRNTEFIRKICVMRVNFNIDLQLATCNLQLAVYRDMQYVIRANLLSPQFCCQKRPYRL